MKKQKRQVRKLKRVTPRAEVIQPKAAPDAATDTSKGVVSAVLVTEEKPKQRSWYDRLFG